MTVHGGDVWQAAEELGIRAGELLDFSANVNPRGLPEPALARLAHDSGDVHLLRLYSDPQARTLRSALVRQLGVAPESIVIGPGAAALIGPVLRSSGAPRALVPVPAFSEYRAACAQQGVEFVPFPLTRADGFRVDIERLCAALEAEHFGVLLLNNPHNPSGALLEANQVRRVLDAAQAAGTTVLLDEAFIDYAPHHSLATEASRRRGLVVLRSLTKFYGCPALRVGYAVTHPETATAIASLLPAWPVTQLAIDALAVALDDCEYAEASRYENRMRREALRESLQSLGVTVFPSAANFLLVELQLSMKRAVDLRWSLLRHRILVRNCDSYEGLEDGRYIRVAVLSEPANARLTDALAAEVRPL